MVEPIHRQLVRLGQIAGTVIGASAMFVGALIGSAFLTLRGGIRPGPEVKPEDATQKPLDQALNRRNLWLD